MLVAQISYTYLSKGESEETKAALQNAFNALLTYYPDSSTVVTSACWMDDLKRRGVYQFSNWHFINLPICDDNETLCESISLSDMLSAGDNIVWAIKEAINVIKSKEAGGFERGFALRNLIHLVGDIHQPLHCVNRFSTETPLGDSGGNLFHIKNFHGAYNLHELWDSGAGLFNNNLKRPLSSVHATYIENWATKIMTLIDPSKIVDGNNITAWAMESIGLSTKHVYNLPYNSYPTKEYITAAHQTIEYQLGIAGYRLAQLLKQIVLCNPSTHNCPIVSANVAGSDPDPDLPDIDPVPSPEAYSKNDRDPLTIGCVLSIVLLTLLIVAVFLYKRGHQVENEESPLIKQNP